MSENHNLYSWVESSELRSVSERKNKQKMGVWVVTANALTAIAAFGGLVLGFVNLGVTVYLHFFRRPRLHAYLRSATMRAHNSATYACFLRLTLKAELGSVALTDVTLLPPQEHCYQDESRYVPEVSLGSLRKSDQNNWEEMSGPNFARAKRDGEDVAVRDFCLLQQEQKSVILIGNVERPQFMGDPIEVQPLGWELVIRHSEGVERLPVNFEFREEEKSEFKRGGGRVRSND